MEKAFDGARPRPLSVAGIVASVSMVIAVAALPTSHAAAASPTRSAILRTSAGTAASAPGITPASVAAIDVIDSVGVNVHLSYNDTGYADTSRVVSLVNRLGVRHVRDGLVAGRPDQVAALQQLANANIRSELILSGAPGLTGPTVDQSQLSELSQISASTDAIEPTNEYDCSGDAQWVSHLRTYASSLHQALQANAATQKLPVLAPSFCRPTSVAQYGTASPIASVTNAHNYAQGQAPELAAESRLPQWSQVQGAALPQQVTETGYSDIRNTSYPFAASQNDIADYTVRSLLDNKRLGLPRTYLYELLDEKPDSGQIDPEQHFGLVNVDGTAKPAYTATANLLTDVARGNADAVTAAMRAPAPYPVATVGGGSLLRSLTVADPNGKGETVALWLAAPTSTPSVPVRVTAGSRVTATTQRPSRGNTLTKRGTGTSFDIPVDGAVTLLHLGAPIDKTAPSCVSSLSYTDQARRLGASVTLGLNPADGWAGAPRAATATPSWLSATGSEIASDGQTLHVAVPKAPTSWTVGVWARTATTSAGDATFLHATGVAGALMRTYNLRDDVPSHRQISAYGAPASGSGYGNETFGNALTGGWHLLVLVAGTTATTLYVDGVAAGSVASGSTPLQGLDLGAISAGFRGALSNLTIFPTALSASSVASLAVSAARACA